MINQKRVDLFEESVVPPVTSGVNETLDSEVPTKERDKQIKVSVNGIYLNSEQSPEVKDGDLMVPMEELFEKLGIKYFTNEKEQIVATKGSTTIELSIDSDVAYVNDNLVSLSHKPYSVDSITMIPLHSISEVLGYTETWDEVTRTVIVTDVVDSNTAVYYEDRDQYEYNSTIDIVDSLIKYYDNLMFGGPYHEQYVKYLNGIRPTNFTEISHDFRGLVHAKYEIGVLVDNGVDRSIIERAYKAATISHSLVMITADIEDSISSSVYNAFITGLTEEDAKLNAAVFKAFGFNTMILKESDNAFIFVEIERKWYGLFGSSFFEME